MDRTAQELIEDAKQKGIMFVEEIRFKDGGIMSDRWVHVFMNDFLLVGPAMPYITDPPTAWAISEIKCMKHIKFSEDEYLKYMDFRGLYTPPARKGK